MQHGEVAHASLGTFGQPITTPLAHAAKTAAPGVPESGRRYAKKLDESEIIHVVIDEIAYEAHLLEDDTACIDACKTDKTAVVMPDEIEGHVVSRLAHHACRHAPNLTAAALPAHTRELGKHAFDRCMELAEVTLNEGLEVIGSFAFANTKLTEFTAPESLRKLGVKVFFHCAQLASIVLNDGLESIGEAAFSGSGIRTLHIPGSVTMLGRDLVKQTCFSDERRFGSLTFGEGSPFLADMQGGLYRRISKGLVLLEMLNLTVSEYVVLPGTVRIADRAFLYHPAIMQIAFPEGLEIIGNAVFKFCRNLRFVSVPDSLRSVGEEAFRSTALERFRIPAGFTNLGIYALSTCSRGNALAEPTLRHVEIDPANEHFYVESGLLCRRDELEGDHAIVYVGPDTDVVIPSAVRYVDVFCFGGVSGVEHLTVHTDIVGVSLGAFFTASSFPRVTVITRDSQGSECRYEAFFPSSTYSSQCFSQAFGGPLSAGVGDEDLTPHGNAPEGLEFKESHVMEPATIFAYADLSIRHCYQINERIALILIRMTDGYFLDDSTRDMFSKSVERHLDEFVVACSKSDGMRFVTMLVDLGFINADNIGHVIDLLGSRSDVKLVSYLLHVQHERFAQTQMVIEDL